MTMAMSLATREMVAASAGARGDRALRSGGGEVDTSDDRSRPVDAITGLAPDSSTGRARQARIITALSYHADPPAGRLNARSAGELQSAASPWVRRQNGA